ncbi:MAG: methyltransferase domain-containing protein [Candidatus Latescibacteria bacterium]|nr:methyltransferase domain-containing protein [Candidatus Latescibacterota bacterium]
MRRLHVLTRHVRRSTGKVLHVGCADTKPIDHPAWLHKHLVKAAGDREVIGIDLNQTVIEAMRQRGYSAEQGDALEMDRRFQGEFGLVVAGEIVEHIPSQLAFLRACRNVLAPDGRLVISTPNPCGVVSVLGYWLIQRESWGTGHVLWQSPRTMATLATEAGLRLAGFQHCDWDARGWWMYGAIPLELFPRMKPTIVYELTRA